MKIHRDEVPFTPITITIESEEDLLNLIHTLEEGYRAARSHLNYKPVLHDKRSKADYKRILRFGIELINSLDSIS